MQEEVVYEILSVVEEIPLGASRPMGKSRGSSGGSGMHGSSAGRCGLRNFLDNTLATGL